MTIKAIIGLGNPGKEYQATRHNIGFMALDAFAARHGTDVQTRRLNGLIVETVIAGSLIILAKPQTYMNLSGQCVKAVMTHYRILPHDILVICDDFNLPRGSIRIRKSGSSGGQKGLSSIIAEIGTDEFPRLRIGIGPMHCGVEAMSFVLGEFNDMEKGDLPELLDSISAALFLCLEKGIEMAMGAFNGKTGSADSENDRSPAAEKTSGELVKKNNSITGTL
ncbi:MAG: aminoacyl-tRNA hydrolase [Vulcanimicrobiota bacterium]